jgi:hypothetical protein
MIDVTRETLIRLEDTRNYLPSSRKGKRLGKAVCFRWAKDGVRGVVLETVKIGGARLTSLEAIQRFVEAQNPRAPSTPTITSGSRPPRRSAKAGDELSARGY